VFPRIALEIAIAGDHPMARHGDGDWIGAIGPADVDGCARVDEAELPRELAVSRGGAGRNEAQRGPDLALQSGTGCGRR
jgi:hypothetical protein